MTSPPEAVDLHGIEDQQILSEPAVKAIQEIYTPIRILVDREIARERIGLRGILRFAEEKGESDKLI